MLRGEYRRGMLRRKEITLWMGQGWRNCKKLYCVQKDMPTKLIRPAIIYGAESLATTKRQSNHGINVNEMRMLRWMYGVTHKDKIGNEHIRGTTRVVQASKKISEQRLKWYGHVTRRDGEHLRRKVLRADIIPGKRKRGRPKIRWKYAIQRDLEKYWIESERGDILTYRYVGSI